MATYYCAPAPTGAAGNTGAIGSPWTLARAVATSGYATLIANGDTVILKDGTYHEALKIRTNGVTFEAQNQGAAILDGKYYETIENKNIYQQPGCTIRSGLPYVVAGKNENMVAIQANNCVIDGIEIRNIAGAGMHVGGNNNIVRNTLIDYCYQACIKVRGTSSNATVDDNLIEDCVFTRGAQVYYANCDRGVGPGCAQNCIGGGPVSVPTCVQNKYTNRTIFRRCEVAYHHGEGINCGDGAADSVIEYCLVHNNNHGNIYLNTGTNPIIRHNLVWTGQRREHVMREGDRFQEAIIIRDEGDGTPGGADSNGTGQQIYNNIFIGGKNVFLVNSNAKNDTRLEDAYIGHNTFIGIGANEIQDEVTTYVININENINGRPHVRSLIENNIFIHLGTSGVGNLAPANNVQGVAFRNNLWSRPNGGSSTPPTQYQGSGDVYTATPKLVNLVEPVDRGVIDGVSSYIIDADNYGPKTGSGALAASSDGSAINGATLVNVTTDYNDAARPSTKTQRDLGAIEFGGAVVTPGTVTADFTFTAGPSGNAPLTVTVDENCSTTAGALVRWIYDWGDGDVEAFTTSANRSHVYDTPGAYTFRLTAENSNGIADDDTGAVTVTANRNKAVIADVRIDAVPTDTSDLDISLSIDSQPPKAALFFMTSATATNTDSAPAMLSIGMWGKYTGNAAPQDAGAAARGAVNMWRLNDNVTRDGDAGNSNSRDYNLVSALGSGGEVISLFGLTAVYNNGLRLKASDVSPSANQLVTVGFGGAELLASMRVVLFDAAAGETAKMTVPFAPDLIFVTTTYDTASATGRSRTDYARFSFGVATQSQAWAMAWGDNVRLTANRVAQNNQATRSSIGIESWDRDGVTFRRYGPAESIKSIDVLALYTGGRAELTSVLTPTSTSATDYPLSSDPGFLMALMTQLGATGWSNGSPGGSAAIYVTDGTDDYTVSWRSVNAADPTDTGSRIDDKLRLPDENGATIMEGAVALGTEEWTATLTTASATPRLWPVLTIGETSAPSGVVADFSADMTTADVREEITFTDRSDDDGDTITLWLWDYGDGSTDSFTVATAPTHAYDEPGRYTVSLTIYTATDEDTETKVDYIRVIAPQNDEGEIYGPYDPEAVTNYSENYVGRRLFGNRPGKISHALDLDALWIDADGPNDGWVPLTALHKIKIGYDPDTGKLRLIRPDGAQATINLNWSAPAAASVDEAEPDLGGTLVLQVASGLDDASEDTGGTVTTTATALVLTAGGHETATRFLDVSIPKGATIETATIEIYIPNTSFDDIDLDIYGHDSDDSPGITTDTNDISSRSYTTATVNWAVASATAGWKTSPDIAAIIQEIVDRDGWASGGAITIIFDATGVASNLQFRSYDYRSDLAAKLTITYTT